MDPRSVAIIIPAYKEEPTESEILSLARTGAILSDYPLFILAPEGLNLDLIRHIIPKADECRLAKEYFDGFAGYNRLMLSNELYNHFLDYEFILVCQQDVFVIEDRLLEFVDMQYDYIGAPIPHMGPWNPYLYVGNGGFSLRRVKAVLNLLERHGKELALLNDNEDIFYSAAGENHPEEFKTAPIEVGLRFAFNMYYEKLYRMNGCNLPMAIHGFGAGDGRFIHEQLDPLCSDRKIHNDNNWRIELGNLYQFIRNSNHLCLYGAGDAGDIFTELVERQGKKVDAYLLSDGQAIPHKRMPAPVYNLSEYPGEWQETDVLITISSRYKNLPDFAGMVRKQGARRIMKMSNELFHAGIGELIISKIV